MLCRARAGPTLWVLNSPRPARTKRRPLPPQPVSRLRGVDEHQSPMPASTRLIPPETGLARRAAVAARSTAGDHGALDAARHEPVSALSIQHEGDVGHAGHCVAGMGTSGTLRTRSVVGSRSSVRSMVFGANAPTLMSWSVSASASSAAMRSPCSVSVLRNDEIELNS